jgi:hypothetical protein
MNKRKKGKKEGKMNKRKKGNDDVVHLGVFDVVRFPVAQYVQDPPPQRINLLVLAYTYP